jgi:pimeloyl-ACP methyl ester carboxylesterase
MGVVVVAKNRVRFEPSGDLPQLPSEPAELERRIENGEARIPDVVPGTEKTLIWADPESRERTELALVYLHGFSASRQELSPLTERLASELGANAFFTRLAGHGRENVDAMSEVTAGDWYRDALEALAVGHAIGEHVVVGSSTGATLATVLAETHPDDVHAIVAVSANYGPPRAAVSPPRRPLSFADLATNPERRTLHGRLRRA